MFKWARIKQCFTVNKLDSLTLIIYKGIAFPFVFQKLLPGKMEEFTKDQNINGHRISTIIHDANGASIVIFCHGYLGTSTGPNRFFVTAARQLSDLGISSLRFDQFGSGNSEGDFFDSSFSDWIKTSRTIALTYLEKGYKVALFGKSMGGSAAIVVGSELQDLSAIVAWVPDPNVGNFVQPDNGIIEETGQIIQARFWQEAYDADVARKLTLVKAPMYIVQCTADEYIDDKNRDAMTMNAQSHHIVENFEGYFHSKWTYSQSREIINKSVNFLLQYLLD